MSIRNQYTELFECGYRQDIAFHKDTTEHGQAKSLNPKPKPMKSVYNDAPKKKLNIKKHFESCSQSRFIKDGNKNEDK